MTSCAAGGDAPVFCVAGARRGRCLLQRETPGYGGGGAGLWRSGWPGGGARRLPPAPAEDLAALDWGDAAGVGGSKVPNGGWYAVVPGVCFDYLRKRPSVPWRVGVSGVRFDYRRKLPFVLWYAIVPGVCSHHFAA